MRFPLVTASYKTTGYLAAFRAAMTSSIFFIGGVFEVPGLSRAGFRLLGALEQLDVFFRDNGGAVFLEDVDQAFDFLFHFAGGQTLLGAQVFVGHLHSPLGVLLGDADVPDTRMARPAAAKSGNYQSSFSNRMPVVSAAYLISSIDHGLPQVITTLVVGSIRSRRASRVRCFGKAGLTVFSRTAFAFATSPPFATICCKSCSSLRGISSK